MSAGLIIYFDGPDGVGKTTQLKLAAEALRNEGRTVYETRALGGTPIGELLREAALSDNPRPVETDLHIAIACQHALAEEILPSRDKGEIVLIDRSPVSILAYQVAGDGLDREVGFEVVGQLMNQVQPDLTIVYHADTAVLRQRASQRSDSKPDFFEAKPAEYHQRVAKGFDDAEAFGAKMIDATSSVDAVHAETLGIIQASLDSRSTT